MSEAAGGSRLTNSNNSVDSATAENQGSGADRELPTPAERTAEFIEEFPALAELPVTARDGQMLRGEFVEMTTERWESEPATEYEDPVKGERDVPDRPLTWGEAVERDLEKYEETRGTTVNLELGEPSDPEYAEHSVESETRWFPAYQKRYYGQLQGWVRELTGGERPSGGVTEPTFEDPHVALITRSASAMPEGERIAPVDHAVEIADAWEDCYHTLRNTLRAAGYELGEDWQYERRMEPHKGERGGGVNRCHGHEHTVVMIDGEVEPELFAPVLEKHVEQCGPAGADAHEIGEAVEVFHADELEDIASYVAAYTGVEPAELLERDVEEIAFAAAMDAANKRVRSRSDAANWASTADACKQRHENPGADQEREHGERVMLSTKRGVEFECVECGSPHEIDQDHDTLAEARLAPDESQQAAVCDGSGGNRARRRNQLRDRWEDARAAVSVGETPTRRERRRMIERELEKTPGARAPTILGRSGLPPPCEELVEEVRAGFDREEPVSFERAPSWRVVSVEVEGEEYPASAGNGVEMVEVDLSDEWRPPYQGGRECPACGAEALLSALEARQVHRHSTDAAYWCETCGAEYADAEGPESPYERGSVGAAELVGELSQKGRRQQLLEAAADGASRSELVRSVDADREAVQNDLEKLLRNGVLYDTGAELRRT